ncbi:MAG: hypothetical protein ACQGVK_10970 [Myxococcota bacterium]
MRPLPDFRWPVPHPAAALFIVLALALAAGPAGAEWLIEMQVTEGGAERPGRIYLDGGNLRLELDDEPPARLIYREDGPSLIHLDSTDQTYLVLDRKAASQVNDELAAAKRAMETQMAALPPEQRAALERMMPGAPAASERPALQIVPTERTRQVDGRSCRVRELRRGGELTGELCVIDWKQAGIARRELRAFRDLARFQQDLVREAAGPYGAALASQPFDAFDGLDGYPVESRQLGGRGGRTRMGLPQERDTDPSRYRPPEGWRQRSLMPGR